MSHPAPPYPPGTLPGYPAADFLPPAAAYTVGSVTAARTIVSGRYLLFGWALANGSTSSGTLTVWDSLSADGTVIGVAYTAAGRDDRLAFNSRGIVVSRGLHVVPSVTPWTGSFFLIPFPPGS